MDTEDEAVSDHPNTQGGTTDDTGPSKAPSTNGTTQLTLSLFHNIVGFMSFPYHV